MSNSPPEGLTRAFHLSHETLFKYLEASLMVFFPSISDSVHVPSVASGIVLHSGTFYPNLVLAGCTGHL